MRVAAIGLLLAASTLASCSPPEDRASRDDLQRDLTLADPSAVVRIPAEPSGAVVSPVELGSSPRAEGPASATAERSEPVAAPVFSDPPADAPAAGLVPAKGPAPLPVPVDGPVAAMPLAGGQTVAIVPKAIPGGLPWDGEVGADEFGGRSGTRVISVGGGVCIPRGRPGLGRGPVGIPTRQL